MNDSAWIGGEAIFGCPPRDFGDSSRKD